MEYVVLSGSIPPGVPDTILAEMIEIARHYKVRCVLDSSGSGLENGLQAMPFMVKPNSHELSAIVGRQLGTVEEAAEAARVYVARGVEIVAVTFGRDGAITATKDGVWRSRPPAIEFVSAVGCGDSFAAGFLYSLSCGGSIADSLKMATASGAANAQYFGAGFCKRDDVLSLLDRVEMSDLS